MPTANSAASVRTIFARLQLVALALMATQFAFLPFGWRMTQGRTAGQLPDTGHGPLIIQIGFAIGVGLIVLSILMARRPVATLVQYGNRFFTGFVLAVSGTLIGFVLCVLVHEILPLSILATAAAGSIYLNYLSITHRILASRELNPPQ